MDVTDINQLFRRWAHIGREERRINKFLIQWTQGDDAREVYGCHVGNRKCRTGWEVRAGTLNWRLWTVALPSFLVLCGSWVKWGVSQGHQFGQASQEIMTSYFLSVVSFWQSLESCPLCTCTFWRWLAVF